MPRPYLYVLYLGHGCDLWADADGQPWIYRLERGLSGPPHHPDELDRAELAAFTRSWWLEVDAWLRRSENDCLRARGDARWQAAVAVEARWRAARVRWPEGPPCA